jgi:hypothetical protein
MQFDCFKSFEFIFRLTISYGGLVVLSFFKLQRFFILNIRLRFKVLLPNALSLYS